MSLQPTTKQLRTVSVPIPTFVVDQARRAPASGSGMYTPPSAAQARELTAAWNAVTRNRLADAQLSAARAGYEVVRVVDPATPAPFIALVEAAGAVRGWGSFVWNPAAAPADATIEAPHPLDDDFSGEIAGNAFVSSGAAALLVAGASRFANSDAAADVAHAPDSAFQSIHLEQVKAASPTIQVHGFDERKHANYGEMVVSSGGPVSDAATGVARLLAGAGYDVRQYDGVNYADLGATRNVQGISSRAAGIPFVHVEITGAIRYPHQRRATAGPALGAAIRGTFQPSE